MAQRPTGSDGVAAVEATRREGAATPDDTVGDVCASPEILLRKAEERHALERRLAEAEKFATIGRLSGSLAHELGAPLSVIGMRAAAIVQQTSAEDASHQQAVAIAHEVARVTAFIHALLHRSRRQRVVFRPVNVGMLVERATADTVSTVEAAQIEIAVSVPAAPVFVNGDEMMLAHALRNVVRNAVQALGGRQAPRRTGISVCVQPSSVLIVVEDNGPGIAADRIAQVFEPFHTTKPVGEGLGLGLPISHGIVVEHGGEIRVENRPEGGLAVTIRLPRDLDDDEARA